MNIRWDHFVNQYDTTRYAGPDGRDTRHIQFVREFASVVSVLQVCVFFFSVREFVCKSKLICHLSSLL
jgi:hypothetical protein